VPNPDNYNFGFVVLCPEKNIGGMKVTVSSIKHAYEKAPFLCCIGDDVTESELTACQGICETHVGGNTITSLINKGIRESKADWNFLVFAGGWIKSNIYRKFDLFVKDEKDILFQVIDGKDDFVGGSMNGIIIHKKSLKLAGEFPTGPMMKADCNELELIKAFWAFNAIQEGCKFKAIIGMRSV
jgi:hypothetical protein